MDPRDILDHYGVTAHKRFSQNFLIDESILIGIADEANLTRDDLVIEIGSGIGNLTEHLLERAGHVVAIEIERAMQAILLDRFNQDVRFSLLASDVLGLNLVDVARHHGWPDRFKRLTVIGNLPYGITGRVLRQIMAMDPSPDRALLLVQKEVAQRMVAQPPRMNMLALSMQIGGDVEIVTLITKDRFLPVPKVDSALIGWTPALRRNRAEEVQILALAHDGFSQKRKKLRNTLAAAWHKDPAQIEEILQKAGIDPNQRAEALSIDAWKALKLTQP